MTVDLISSSFTLWELYWTEEFKKRFSERILRLFSEKEFDLFSQEYPIFNVRALPITDNEERMCRLSEISVSTLILELERFSIPTHFCAFRHHFSESTWKIIHPENCALKDWNLSCGHPELNWIVEYLVLAYMYLEKDFDEKLLDYVYGILFADFTAQDEGDTKKWDYSMHKDIFEMSQNIYGNKWKELVQWIVSELKFKFG